MRKRPDSIVRLVQGLCASALLAAALAAPSAAQDSASGPRARRTPPTPKASPQTPPTPVQSGPARAPDTPARPAGVEPDLSITARVTADSLRFEKVPNTRVDFTGRPGRETVWEAERENLPQEVRPGVTYRNVGITLRITSVFADIDRIVAEALGEIPPGDEARPSPPPAPTAAPAPTPPAGVAAPPRATTQRRRNR